MELLMLLQQKQDNLKMRLWRLFQNTIILASSIKCLNFTKAFEFPNS